MRDRSTATGKETLTAELTTMTEDAGWTADAVAELLRRAAETGVTVLDLETAAVRLHLRRGAVPGEAQEAPQAGEAQEVVSEATDAGADGSRQVIAAPVLGIFYRAAKPDQPPLVEVGAQVTAGQTVGLIEVMKTFHEVTADQSARITAALVENGAAVQYGQPLFAIEQIEDSTPDAAAGDAAP
jgi:biotin carboxyl carrier protein